jgi:hypothetical protein
MTNDSFSRKPSLNMQDKKFHLTPFLAHKKGRVAQKVGKAFWPGTKI